MADIGEPLVDHDLDPVASTALVAVADKLEVRGGMVGFRRIVTHRLSSTRKVSPEAAAGPLEARGEARYPSLRGVDGLEHAELPAAGCEVLRGPPSQAIRFRAKRGRTRSRAAAGNGDRTGPRAGVC